MSRFCPVSVKQAQEECTNIGFRKEDKRITCHSYPKFMAKGGGGRGGGASMGVIGAKAGGSIGKAGPIIGGGGPERGGFSSVGFAPGFAKAGGREAVRNALRFNSSQRFSEGGPRRTLNTNFPRFEAPKPNLGSKAKELFRVPASGILRTEGLHAIPRIENQFSRPRPNRPLLENVRGSVSSKGPTLDQAREVQLQPQGRTLDEVKKQAQINELTLEESVLQRLSRILGSKENARIAVAKARKFGNLTAHPNRVTGVIEAAKQRVGLARVLTAAHPAEAVASAGAQTESVTIGAATSTKTESDTQSQAATKTREVTQTVSEKKQKVATQKAQEKAVKRDKSAKTEVKRKNIQEYIAAMTARLTHAREIYNQKLEENREKGVDKVSGADVANDYAYTTAKESIAIRQLGRNHPDGSELETRAHLASEKDLTPSKIETIVEAHAAGEVVEDVATRQLTSKETAEIFEDLEHVPALIPIGASEKLIYATASSAKVEKITEEVKETGENKQSQQAPTISAPTKQPASVVQPETGQIPTNIIQFPNRLALIEEYLETASILKAA